MNNPKLNIAIPRPASEIIFIEYFTKLGIPTFHLKETKDQRSPKTLEYVLGLRESFLPTTRSISLSMTMACGISWLVTASFEFVSSGAGILQLSLKLISFSAISLPPPFGHITGDSPHTSLSSGTAGDGCRDILPATGDRAQKGVLVALVKSHSLKLEVRGVG